MKALYGIWSWANGGWNLLYQYNFSQTLQEASRILLVASRNLPKARLKIDIIPES